MQYLHQNPKMQISAFLTRFSISEKFAGTKTINSRAGSPTSRLHYKKQSLLFFNPMQNAMKFTGRFTNFIWDYFSTAFS